MAKIKTTTAVDTYSFTQTMPTELYSKLLTYVQRDGGYRNVQEMLNKMSSDFTKTEEFKRLVNS